MFVRTKSRGNRAYLQIVENHRLDGRIVQNVIANLGRLDLLQQSGALDSLMLSMQRFSPKMALLGEIGRQETTPLSYRRLGSPLLFGRLWRELGIDRAIDKLAKGRKFEFSLERTIFTSVLHRLAHSGSDRSAMRWLTDYRLEGAAELELRHFYRAMAWLGTPLPEAEIERPGAVEGEGSVGRG
jgi:hypothetical protein